MQDERNFRAAVFASLGFVLLLWVLHGLFAMLAVVPVPYGVYPRQVGGLIGILTAPLLHVSWQHLLANTPALFVLGVAVLYEYPRAARLTLPILYLGSGALVWLVARESYHLGASGLTHGLLFFVFIIGILRRERQSVALALMVFFLYGGMIWGVLPSDPDISFESHAAGALLGAVLAFLLRGRDPLLPRKRYDWEDEDGDDEDAYWTQPGVGQDGGREREGGMKP